MTERPIIFSAPMVLAILAGTKTQTRRIVRFDDRPASAAFADWPSIRGVALNPDFERPSMQRELQRFCPYGTPGDRLWVREAFRERQGKIFYRATPPTDDFVPEKWTPSIYMRRAYSRVTLEVKGIRVERLQAIAEADVKAEGVAVPQYSEHWTAYDPETEGYPSFSVEPDAAYIARRKLENVRHHPAKPMMTAVEAFAIGWDTINGDRATWSSNPWVWVVEFARVAAERSAA